MGEAKRRAAAYIQAKSTLLGASSGEALVVAEAAIKLFEGFILFTRYTGGCYLTTMILHRFLEEERGIGTEPVVGYVNDGTDDIMISHAWLEHAGRKVDLTLHLTEHCSTGALIVLDQVLRNGQLTYSYHREQTSAGIAQEQVMLRDPQLAPIVWNKRVEHETMIGFTRNPDAMTRYLAAAPREQGYEAMARVLRR